MINNATVLRARKLGLVDKCICKDLAHEIIGPDLQDDNERIHCRFCDTQFCSAIGEQYLEALTKADQHDIVVLDDSEKMRGSAESFMKSGRSVHQKSYFSFSLEPTEPVVHSYFNSVVVALTRRSRDHAEICRSLSLDHGHINCY